MHCSPVFLFNNIWNNIPTSVVVVVFNLNQSTNCSVIPTTELPSTCATLLRRCLHSELISPSGWLAPNVDDDVICSAHWGELQNSEAATSKKVNAHISNVNEMIIFPIDRTNHTGVIEEKENPREKYNEITSHQVTPSMWGERAGINWKRSNKIKDAVSNWWSNFEILKTKCWHCTVRKTMPAEKTITPDKR